MIRKDDILKIARMSRLRPHQQEKHYIQTLTLRSLYSRFDPVFKGGTAMMFFHGLNRFSEDLDFTINRNFDSASLLNGIKDDMELMGVSAYYKVMSDGVRSFSFRIGAEGPLFTKEIERCFVRVEMSKREDVIMTPDVKFFAYDYPDILPFSVTIMALEEMAAEKIRAIMTRDKARDIYDLQFLMKKDVELDIDLINRKLAYYNISFDHNDMVQRIDSKRDIWPSELKPIVIGELSEFDSVEKVISNALERVA